MIIKRDRLERLPERFRSELEFPLEPEIAPEGLGHVTRWLEALDGVESVRHDARAHALVIRYDERRGAGEYLRGVLHDRLRPPPPATLAGPQITIAHSVPGRARLRVHGGSERVVEQLAQWIEALDGVERARASPASRSIVVFHDPAVIAADEVLARTRAAELAELPEPPRAPPDPRIEWLKTGFSTAALLGAISGVVPAPVVYGSIALAAIPPARRAIEGLARREVNIDVLDATAIGISFLRGDPITAGLITSLLALGDLILERTQARAHVAISRLMQLDDGVAFVADPDGKVRRVDPRELAAGMKLVIYPGARVPADGVIVEGSLSLDEKALTGESLPRDRHAGERVLAASVALQGQAVVLVERAGGDTIAGRILRILEGAGTKPMTLQRNAQRVADKLVIPTFATAGLAYAVSGVIDRLTSVLITDFGTGVRVAVPTAALTAMTLAAREGVLVKGATFLERLAEADTIVFDKTGTLTLGVPEVKAIVCTSTRFDAATVISYAAAAEGNHAHPIADAIRRHAEGTGATARTAEPGGEHYRIGLGLVARVDGKTVHLGNPRLMREAGIDPTAGEHARHELASHGASSVLLAIDGELAGVIGYADAPRPESAAVVAALRANGRRHVMLLSGDARAPVEAIARTVGIDEAIADVLPQDKVDVVRRLKAEGRKVAMVGDGINDAPALAVADIGISLHGGTEVALETADVVLLEGGLDRLPAVFDIADGAMRRVKEVLGLVLAPNALAIAAGALGFINPITAAIINNGSTIAAAVHAVFPLLKKSKPR